MRTLPQTSWLELARELVERSKADQTEVQVSERDRSLTRFANSEIHQNVAERDVEVRVRVIHEGRTGVAVANDLTEDGLGALLARAQDLARHAPVDPDPAVLPGPQRYAAPASACVAATRAFSPAQRAHMVGLAARLATEAGLKAFGAFETGWGKVAIANSRGLAAEQEATQADFNLVFMSDDASGFASWTGSDVSEIDAEALARRARDKALRGAHPQSLAPGTYPVLLEPDAMADVVEYVSQAGLGGRGFVQGTSFMAGHLGERLVGSNITLWDDPLAADMVPECFDGEGVARRKLCLFEEGIARAVAHDSATAHQAGVTSTGNAFPAPSEEGPFPARLRLAPGTATYPELLARLDRGILVTRFHYTNLADALSATITGMTRDGTFWVEGGEIVRPLKNLRFTQGALEALRHVVAMTQETKLIPGWFGHTRVPAALIEAFRFSGATNF